MIPNISAYLSSIRPYRWMSIHEMLSKTGLSFEIIIVGPNDPNFSLPKEINFYKSDVKPSQCFHAAATMSTGETLLQIVDDMEYQDGGIEAMYRAVIEKDNIMATCKYHMNGISTADFQNMAGSSDSSCYPLPFLPVCGLYRRHVYSDMGGLDRRFNGVMSELDLYMRMSVYGYGTHFVDFIGNENRTYQEIESQSLYQKFASKDRPEFVRLWSTNGNLYPIRRDIVRKYENKNLLTENQNFK